MPFKSSDAVQIFTSRNNYSSNGYIPPLAPLTTLQYLALSCTFEYLKLIDSLHAIALQKAPEDIGWFSLQFEKEALIQSHANSYRRRGVILECIRTIDATGMTNVEGGFKATSKATQIIQSLPER